MSADWPAALPPPSAFMSVRKRPIVVQAWNVPVDAKPIEIPTLEGTMIAMPGDWVIIGTNGELYPCKPDIFTTIYEPAWSE